MLQVMHLPKQMQITCRMNNFSNEDGTLMFDRYECFVWCLVSLLLYLAPYLSWCFGFNQWKLSTLWTSNYGYLIRSTRVPEQN